MLWERLEKWQRNTENGMSKEKYLELCDQMEEEPDEARMPPGIEDFPEDVQKAIIIFSKLPDRIVTDIGYLGKDYTPLPLHMEVAEVLNKEIFLETILRLDHKIIEKSAESMKREREKLKNKK